MARVTARLVCVLALLGLALGVTSGCRTEVKKVGQLKGKVMFKGQPVAAGYISFTPDNTQGNLGKIKVAQIKDGMYDTSLALDAGVVPGATMVRIAGFDGKPVPKFAQGKQIFNLYELNETLSEGTAIKDFTVPDSAADNLKIEPTADR
jgi:hypothetical protein